jgi:hypothetical protein
MEIPRSTLPQSQLLPNNFATHSGYETPPRSPGSRSASVAAPNPDLTASTMSPQEPPVQVKPVPPTTFTVEGMHRYERVVNEETQRRYQDVLSRLANPLATYMRKGRHEHRPMAIRLMFLGRDEDSARPWIVVLCPELVKKKAEKFLKQDIARRIYQSDEPERESFQVVVIGHPPQPKAGESGNFVKVAARSTHKGLRGWSLQVEAEHHGIVSHGIMGGYVVIGNSDDGTETIYGLTAGHIIHQGEDDSPPLDEPLVKLMPSPASSDSEDEDTTVPKNGPPIRAQSVSGSSTSRQSVATYTQLPISDVSSSRKARDRDWALVGRVDASQIRYLDASRIYVPIVLGTVGEVSLLQIGFRREFDLDCTLSLTACMILTPSGYNFVSAHMLIPGNDTLRLLPIATLTCPLDRLFQTATRWYFWCVGHCTPQKPPIVS